MHSQVEEKAATASTFVTLRSNKSFKQRPSQRTESMNQARMRGGAGYNALFSRPIYHTATGGGDRNHS